MNHDVPTSHSRSHFLFCTTSLSERKTAGLRRTHVYIPSSRDGWGLHFRCQHLLERAEVDLFEKSLAQVSALFAVCGTLQQSMHTPVCSVHPSSTRGETHALMIDDRCGLACCNGALCSCYSQSAGPPGDKRSSKRQCTHLAGLN